MREFLIPKHPSYSYKLLEAKTKGITNLSEIGVSSYLARFFLVHVFMGIWWSDYILPNGRLNERWEGVNSLRRNGRLESKRVNYVGDCDTSRSVDSESPGFERDRLESFSKVFVGAGGQCSVLERVSCAAEGYLWVRMMLLLNMSDTWIVVLY